MTENDKLVIILSLIFTFIAVGFPVLLYYFKVILSYSARKIIHSLAGLTIFILIFLDSSIWAFLFSGIITLLVLASTNKSKIPILKYFFESINEAEEVELGYLQGPVSYGLAITVLCLIDVFLPSYEVILIVSMLTMMYADTLAAIIGKKYGKVKIFGLKRSLEGSLTFFIVSFIISFTIFSQFGENTPNAEQIILKSQTILISVAGALGATVIELFSPSKWDDILIPFGMTGLLIGLVNII